MHSDHILDLCLSGLNDATIQLMGARSVIPRDVPGFENGLYARVNTVLEFPYPNVENFSRYKLFPAIEMQDGRRMKYYVPSGTVNRLYILPPIVAALNDVREPLLLVEGEKKAAAGVQHGLKAVGFSGIWNWKETNTWTGIEDLKTIPLADRSITIVPDSDTWLRDDLQRAVYAFARYLESRGAKVMVVLLPQSGKEKVGLDDYLLTHSIDDLAHEKWLPLKHATLRQHKNWYEEWKKQKTELARLKSLFLADDEPCPEMVVGDQLLDLLTSAVLRYIAVLPAAAHTVALWVLHAWTLDAFDISPYLFLTSPIKRCGKTNLLDLVLRLTPRAIAASNITGPAIFRAIEYYAPTLIIDEADSFLGEKEELRGILNAGHRRSTAFVIRTVGDNHEVKLFSVWAAKAIAGIGRIADTLEDRSIIIHMRRRSKGEKVERFRATEVDVIAKPLRCMAARWSKDNVDALRHVRPTTPDELNDRARDNWDPLLAIAELAGGEWPARARAAALALSGETDEAEGSALVDLLRDLQKIFEDRDRIFSADLVKQLSDNSDGRWVEWNRGKPITQRQVARLLEPLNIRPRQIRIGGESLKGYLLEWFNDPFNRYLAQEPCFDPKQAKQPSDFNGLGEKNGPQQYDDVSDGKGGVSVRNGNDVSDVSDEKGVSGEGRPVEDRNGLDSCGFDWVNGQQVEFIDGDGKLNYAASVEDAWATIKGQRAMNRNEQ